MNSNRFRSKRVLITTGAAVVVLGAGGAVWGTTAAGAADDRALTATERTSAEAAALTAVAGGTVTDVEASDDQGVAYEVEVRAADAAEWDVELDSAFQVLTTTQDQS